jgi:hypothetical protein
MVWVVPTARAMFDWCEVVLGGGATLGGPVVTLGAWCVVAAG